MFSFINQLTKLFYISIIIFIEYFFAHPFLNLIFFTYVVSYL